MQFIGIDLHTNKFTCSYRNETAPADAKKGKRIETFELNGQGLAMFYQTLTQQTYVLIEATIITFCFCTVDKIYSERGNRNKHIRVKTNSMFFI